MQLSKLENTLNARYDFLRRSVISYYSKCMNMSEVEQKHNPVPCDIAELLKFTKDLFYNYLREEYKQ